MSCTCTLILVGVVSMVSEIWLPFKKGQISLLGHGDIAKSVCMLLYVT